MTGYRIDGEDVGGIADLYEQFNREFMRDEDWEMGASLDALNDVLHRLDTESRDGDQAVVVWHDHARSREVLGFEATQRSGVVSALLTCPANADCLLVLAHGAGAGMRHPFMEALAGRLAARRIATFRYQFPYMDPIREASTDAPPRRRPPDRPPKLLATVRAALDHARTLAADLPLFAGGKSMGGRMTSQLMAEQPDACGTGDRAVRGIVFVGFPLHPPKKPATKRAEHLGDVAVPLLFLQGTRDALADLELLRPIVEAPTLDATLHVTEDADHGFHVRKNSARTDEEVLDELATITVRWANARCGVR